MVKGSDKTYGELMLEARSITDHQEIGETIAALLKHLDNMIEEIAQLQAEDSSRNGKLYKQYYIWVRFRKEPYANNALHIYPMCRISRPSPYQDSDHILWSVTNMNEVKYEWNVMSEGMTNFVLANKPKFDDHTVKQALAYKNDTLEKPSDYFVHDSDIPEEYKNKVTSIITLA